MFPGVIARSTPEKAAVTDSLQRSATGKLVERELEKLYSAAGA